jgi:hypothetical protein
VLLAIAGFAVLFLVYPKASAAINPQINFQGKLTNPDGTNVTNGTYSIMFSIYSASSGGGVIWTETQSSVATTDGVFQASLGSVTALPGSVNFASNSLYLGVKVGSDSEMTPRIKFTAAPYAFNAATADNATNLGGIGSSGYVQISPGSAQTGNISLTGNISASGTYNSNTFSSSSLIFGATSPASIQSASSQNLAVDSGSSGVLNLGTVNSTGITLGKFGVAVTAPGGLNINSGTNVPTVDQVSIDNTSSTGVTTADVVGLNVHYKGGAAAVEAAGIRMDYTPGTTSGGTWSGMRIVENMAAAAGVKSYGLKLEGGGTGSGSSYGIEVASGWDIGIDVQSGGLQLAVQTDPAAPAAGNLRIYAKDIAGRMMPKWLGPSGVDTPFQASLGFNRVAFTEPTGTANCSTGSTGLGSTSTGAGTCTVPTLVSTNLLTSVRRISYSSGTTVGAIAYQRQSQLQVWRGNVAGVGGFFYTTRFALSTLATGNRAFVGLSSSIATPTNVDPTTSPTIGKVGMVINANTGNWNFASNAAGSAPTFANLGASFPVNTTDIYELILYSAPNGSSIGYRVTDISTGAQTSGSAGGNIPTNTTFLAPQFWITNNAASTAAIMDFVGWYLESDD